MMTTTSVSAQLFVNAWQVYKKILNANLMYHQEINNAISAYCHQHLSKQAIHLLDLGCGDASQAIQAFSSCHVTHYTGCDSSNTALDEARKCLAYTQWQANLILSDLIDALAQMTQQYHVIYISYVLHHYPFEDKKRFFEYAVKRLHPQGRIMMVDVMREPQQSRQVYLKQYCDRLTRHQDILSPAEMDLVVQHVQACDFPAELQELEHYALQHGLSQIELIANHGAHKAIVFQFEHE